MSAATTALCDSESIFFPTLNKIHFIGEKNEKLQLSVHAGSCLNHAGGDGRAVGSALLRPPST